MSQPRRPGPEPSDQGIRETIRREVEALPNTLLHNRTMLVETLTKALAALPANNLERSRASEPVPCPFGKCCVCGECLYLRDDIEAGQVIGSEHYCPNCENAAHRPCMSEAEVRLEEAKWWYKEILNEPQDDETVALAKQRIADHEAALQCAIPRVSEELLKLADKWDSADYAIEQVSNPLLPQEQCAIELRAALASGTAGGGK